MRRLPRIARTFFALQVKRIVNSELAFEDVVIAKAQFAEAVGDPA